MTCCNRECGGDRSDTLCEDIKPGQRGKNDFGSLSLTTEFIYRGEDLGRVLTRSPDSAQALQDVSLATKLRTESSQCSELVYDLSHKIPMFHRLFAFMGEEAKNLKFEISGRCLL